MINIETLSSDYIAKNADKIGCMNFTDALCLLVTGRKLKRLAWTDKLFVTYIDNNNEYQQHIDVHYDDGTVGAWSVSQPDMFANDWQLV